MKKKIIVYPTCIWAEKLLSLDCVKKVDYFIGEADNNGLWHDRPVYPPERLLEEDKDNICIIISDTRQYESISERLNGMGFAENVHYFDGWCLPEAFFLRVTERNWLEFEQPGSFARPSWDRRAQVLSSMIPEDVRSIIDFGCGNQRLKKHLRPDVKYIGVDYTARDKDTVIFDVNRDELPAIQADCAYMAGFLMYIKDLEKFFRKLHYKYLVFSYQGTETYATFGEYLDRGHIMCGENYKFLWDIVQLALDNQYTLRAMRGNKLEMCCLFEKNDYGNCVRKELISKCRN